MADINLDWDDLGRSIQDVVDRAVNSRDYQKLNQTISQVVGRAVNLGEEAVRKVVDGKPRTASATAVKRYQTANPVAEQKKDLPVLYGNTSTKTAKGILKLVGGTLVSGSAFVFLVTSLILLLVDGGFFPVGLSLAGLGGGIWLLSSGVRGLTKVSRFKTYRKLLGQKTHCALEKLARGVGRNVKFVRRELRQMINEGLFLEGHLDREEQNLITSNETYRHYEQSLLQLEQRQQEAARLQQASASRDPRVQEVLDKGNEFIAQIRRCNDAIPGQQISEKISRIELIVQRIFERADAHPQIVPDLKKMMDYYLPMTVKLLNAYADMDAQPVQGETIQASKREIEATLDTLNVAFEKLLDSVFKDTALDVSSDISVLNTLLAQEGLTEDELTKMKKQQNL